MRKRIAIGFTLVLLGWIFCCSQPGESFAGDVSINIGIGVPPPHVVVAAPPSVFLIPDSYVYFAPEVGIQLFFYSGYWFLLNDGYWYRSSYYKGPWSYLPPSRVPIVFLHLPPRYFEVPHGQKLIPYGQLKKHWREWEKPQYQKERDWEKSYHEHWKDQDKGWKQWEGSKPAKKNQPGKVGKPGKGNPKMK